MIFSRRTVIAFISLLLAATVFLPTSTVLAQSTGKQVEPVKDNQPSSSSQLFPVPNGIPQTKTDSNTIQTISNLVFGLLGGISVLIIVIAGLRFVINQGNPQEVTKARNTIIYALLGLVVALSAWTIVSFVLGKL